MVVLKDGLCVDYLPMIKHLNKNVYCLSDKFSNIFTPEICDRHGMENGDWDKSFKEEIL